LAHPADADLTFDVTAGNSKLPQRLAANAVAENKDNPDKRFYEEL
jgi:hypothetical protein